MNPEILFLIITRFPGWSYVEGSEYRETEHRGDGKDEYPAFGVRYLIAVPVSVATEGTYPSEEASDEELLNLRTEEQNAARYFKERFETQIGKPFDGEILFVEPFDVRIF